MELSLHRSTPQPKFLKTTFKEQSSQFKYSILGPVFLTNQSLEQESANHGPPDGPQNLNYLLPDPIQKKFADSWLRGMVNQIPNALLCSLNSL